MNYVFIICLLALAYIFAIWIAERVYLWRIMGILTPEEYKRAKWFKYALLNGGPLYIINSLNERTDAPDIILMNKIRTEVKIPKLLLTNGLSCDTIDSSKRGRKR